MDKEAMQASQLKLEITAPNLGMTGTSPSRIPMQESESPQIERQNMDEVMKLKDDMDHVVSNLDDKLNLVLAKQEYEYLKSYNIYVKRKEKELRELIDKLNEKNSNNTQKDEKINNLEKTIKSIRDDQIRMEKEKDEQAKKIKKWQSRSNNFEQERDFLQKQVLESKRQNKLLKLAIGRLQNQISTGPELSKIQGEEEVQGDTFLTEGKPVNFNEKKGPVATDPYGLSTMQGSKEEHTQAQTSFIGAQNSYLTSGPGPAFVNSLMESNMKRATTGSPQSRYKNIPSENLKFQRFIELIFKSKMDKEEIQNEIIMYVQALETNYNDTIRDLKLMVEKEKKLNKKANFEKVNEVTQKNELENLFVECIEEIRKDIMKRRLKNEIFNKKKFQQIDKNSEEAKEFESSLLKLAQLAKNRVKINEFTSKDRNNLLDLFVNNERTLLKIYEILFPHRASPGVGAGVSNQMVAESGNGVYGQNAIRALSRGNPVGGNMALQSSYGSGMPFQSNITAQNNNFMNQFLPQNVDYNQEMMKQGGFLPQSQILPNIMGAQKNQRGSGKFIGSKSNVAARTFTAESGTRQGIPRNQSHEQNGVGQPSHLGVYRHDTSVSLMKPNSSQQDLKQQDVIQQQKY